MVLWYVVGCLNRLSKGGEIMARKLKSAQSLSIILGGGIVAISVAGFAFALGGAGLPLAGEIFAGLAGMAAGARIA